MAAGWLGFLAGHLPEEEEKSQHGCIRWALCEHIIPPCGDFACGGLKDCVKRSCKQRPICIEYFLF